MKRKFISIILILSGVAIMIYPKTLELYYTHKQQRLIDSWQASLSIIDKEYDYDDEAFYDLLSDERKGLAIKRESALEEKRRAKSAKKQFDEYIENKMEGVIVINKINLNLPILRGINEKNMAVTVASMEHTGEAGKSGNYIIAGHRSRTYGRNFNRLNEVENDDIIEIETKENKYTYTVTEKLYVLPEETWVLNSDKNKNEITLITCHPMGNPTHRLIIKGEIIE